MKTKDVAVICMTALLIISISIYEIWLFAKNENSKSWVQVEGRIIQAIWEPKNYRVTYEYLIDGQILSSSKVSYVRVGSEIKEEKYKQGELVTVYVNPNDHAESVIAPIDKIPFAHYSSTLFFITGIVLLALGIIYGRRSEFFKKPEKPRSDPR